MNGSIPPRVLIARLSHELAGVSLALRAENYDKALDGVRLCIDLGEQIREAV